MPEDFEVSLLATGKRFTRTVDGQGGISWKRYRLYVRAELKKEKIEIREFFDSLVIVYKSGTVASYECIMSAARLLQFPTRLCSMIIRGSNLQRS